MSFSTQKSSRSGWYLSVLASKSIGMDIYIYIYIYIYTYTLLLHNCSYYIMCFTEDLLKCHTFTLLFAQIHQVPDPLGLRIRLVHQTAILLGRFDFLPGCAGCI